MRDKVVAQRAYYGVRSRPFAAVYVHLRMLRCGPSKRPFVHSATFGRWKASVSAQGHSNRPSHFLNVCS